MFKQQRYLFVLFCLFNLLWVGFAQDAGDIYTFDNGIQFTVPANSVLDDSGSLPLITLANAALIDIVEPDVIGETPDATKELPLVTVLDFLLSAVGYEGERAEDETISMKLLDGREVMAYNFINATDNYQLIFVLRMSDGRIGALNVRSREPLTQEMVTAIGDLANSFDIPETSNAPEPTELIEPTEATEVTDDSDPTYVSEPADDTENTPKITAEEAELIADLTQEFTYPSGVSFRYPEDFILINKDNPPVTIGIDQIIIMTMVDPNQVGMPSGEAMQDIIDFAIGSTSFVADDFAPINVGGREAVFATVENETVFQSMLIVAFADETYGIMDIVTAAKPTDEHIDMIRSVAASFNSAGSQSGITRADIEDARILFESAMDSRDEGEYEAAIEQFTLAIKLNPELALAYYWRASTYQRLGQVEKAVADYRKALELEPEEIQIQADIANTYALFDEMDEAVAELEAFIELVGEDTVGEEVIESLDVYRAVANGEYNEDFYFRRANRLRNYGLYDLALENNQLTIDNDPDDAELYAQRGVIYVDMEDYDAAIDAFTEGLEIELLPILFYNRGVAHRSNSLNELGSMIDGVHDLQCLLLLADDSITEDQIAYAERSINTTLISSDDYEPITDPANCVP